MCLVDLYEYILFVHLSPTCSEHVKHDEDRGGFLFPRKSGLV